MMRGVWCVVGMWEVVCWGVVCVGEWLNVHGRAFRGLYLMYIGFLVGSVRLVCSGTIWYMVCRAVFFMCLRLGGVSLGLVVPRG